MNGRYHNTSLTNTTTSLWPGLRPATSFARPTLDISGGVQRRPLHAIVICLLEQYEEPVLL
jgi:hypothetical protein